MHESRLWSEMRILVAVNGGVGRRVTGPEIRGWEMARALAVRHEVTVAVNDPPSPTRDGLRLVSLSRGALIREARRHDAVIGPILPPYLFATLWGTSTVTVSDQYDPVHLELSILTDQPGISRVLRAQRMVRRMQLRFADVIVCAGERQGALLREELQAIPERESSSPTIATVPFGVTERPSSAAPGALRARFPAIGIDDPVVLWWGKIWKWFDAATAIRAFELVVRRRPDARLVISAGKAPKEVFDRSATTDEARALASELALLDRNVFFLDEWVPYDRRHDLLRDADAGITLHAETAEAPFAARARYMDYLWTALPPVLARGDEVAERFGQAGFARLVPPGDTEWTADAILGLIEDPEALATARAAGDALADEYRWSTLVRPLAEAIEDRALRFEPPKTLSRSLVRDAGAYYLRRAVDRVAALPRPTGS
jgi:glycosyltransferase involved in cell wall biosynthesis